MKKKLFIVISLVLVFSLVLASCGKKEEEFEPGSTTDRKGGWLDQVTMSVVSSDSALTQIQAGTLDLYADSVSSKEDLIAINNAGLDKSTQFGLYYELTLNPVGPTFDGTGKLNPFSNQKIREALNWLVDRDYINQEVYGGGSFTKYLPITSGLPDYAKYIDVARRVEAKYAYDMDKADSVITTEMEALGAEKTDGKWMYDGEQVELIFLIRNDSDKTRIPIGDYIADQLESLGFKVDRQYKSGSEASPIWVLGDPNDGLWHIYTGAWSATAIDRDVGDNFQFFYSPASVYGFTALWQAYELDDETYEVCEALANNTFSTLEERAELFETAMLKTAEAAYRIWLIDGASYSFWDSDVITSYDLAAGVDVSSMTPFTLRFKEQEGGNMNWGTSDLFIDPVNPVGGSNWTYDHQWQNFTQDYATLMNPFSGLPMKQRIDRAEIVVEQGLPVVKSSDWIDLSFEETITVPTDAWIDWDVENQVFKNVGDVHPEGLTAKRKSTVYYPADFFETVKWHDGSSMSPADFVMGMIMTFDVGMEGSAIYDEAMASSVESFKSTFKGMKVTSVDPLTIEYYSDTYYMDAEYNVAAFWPDYGYGNAGWHQIAISNLADAAGELAYSADKATANEIEWMSYIGGPSLEILEKHNITALTDKYIPYEPTLGAYITADEAAERYQNLSSFYADKGHFYIGTGPYVLDKVLPVENTLTLVTNPDFVDYSDKWSEVSEPKMATVEIDGKTSISSGAKATFDVDVTYKGAAYPADEIIEVKYLLYDSTGAVSSVGEAEMVKDGEYKVEVTEAETAALGTGACKLEIAVVAIPVSIPSFAVWEFVTE